MKIIAIICVRNELVYLREVIPYLENERIDVILIDNESTDDTLDVISGAEYKNIHHIETLPFRGHFDLSAQLDAKVAVVENADADWIIHQDADEILQSPTEWGGLRRHIEHADSQGFNVLNFNEIVMLPANPQVDDFIHNNSTYYFFEPRPLRLMRAWKKAAKLVSSHTGGHVLDGDDVVVYPQRMLLKHFIVRTQQHAFEKYLGRVFSSTDLKKGWHGNRLNFNEKNLTIPTCGPHLHNLEDPKKAPAKLPRSAKTHFWEWSPPVD
jgi:glycosyltransferase involved in cell wall biosynthesis